MIGKLDEGRVDDTHNPTTHMHEGRMLDEVLYTDGGVDDGWMGVMDAVDGGRMRWMGRWWVRWRDGRWWTSVLG